MLKALRSNALLCFTCNTFALLFAVAITATLTGCQEMQSSLASSSSDALTAKVKGSAIPVSEASIKLYAMKSGGPSESLLTKSVSSAAGGGFSIAGLYTCPDPAAQTYLVATGGKPTNDGTQMNSQAALVALLGPCGSISTGAIEVNEITTIASMSAMMADLTSTTQMGSNSTAAQLAADYTLFTELVNPATGMTPGLSVPSGYFVQTTKINAMADILATCVDSEGGKTGDGSPCGILFKATTTYGNPVPTDTAMAARAMAMDWNLNLSQSLALAQGHSTYSPLLTAEPADWDLKLLPTTATPVISPASGLYAAGTTVSITDATPGAIIHFTTDGSSANCYAPVYTQPFALVSAAKVNASAISGNVCSLYSPTAVYTIRTGTSVSAGGLSLSVPSEDIATGASYQGTLTRSKAINVAAVVSLSSSLPSAVAVTPASITIPAGQTSVPFTYYGAGVGDATLSATASGYDSTSVAVNATGSGIPANYFGLSVLHFSGLKPNVPYGTTRSWDVSFPGVSWADINPVQGTYNWAGVDGWLAANAGNGVDLIYTLGRTPQWASSNKTAPGTYGPGQCASPANIADWDTYVTSIAQHAAGRVKYWELWNEPQDVMYYCSNVPAMVTMAQHAYKIIKSIDPAAVVLSPAAVSEAGATWLQTYLADGGGAYADVIAFHGYSGATAEAMVKTIAYFKQAMAAGGVSKLPIWDTEASWGDLNGVPAITNAADQGSFLAKAFLLQWSNGISRFVWYAWDSAQIWGQLSTTAGVNPAGEAYQQVFDWMVGSTMSQPCAMDASGNWSCGFSKTGGYVSEALWNSTKNTTLKVSTQYKQYRDLVGKAHTIVNNTVPVGNSPILLEN